MKYLGNFFAVVVVLGILVVIGWSGYLGVIFVIDQFGVVSQEGAAIMMIAAVVFLVSSMIIAGAIRNRNMGGDKYIRPEKATLYSRYIELLLNKSPEPKKEAISARICCSGPVTPC